jgi:hypothetical protein
MVITFCLGVIPKIDRLERDRKFFLCFVAVLWKTSVLKFRRGLFFLSLNEIPNLLVNLYFHRVTRSAIEGKIQEFHVGDKVCAAQLQFLYMVNVKGICFSLFCPRRNDSRLCYRFSFADQP